MTKTRLWILLAVALGLTLLGVIAYSAFRTPMASTPAGGKPAQAGPGAPAGGPGAGGARPGGPPGGFPLAVEIAAVARQPIAEAATAVGSLRSNESVMLRPEASGRIIALPFREGQHVARGALLVELDSAIQRAELMQAKANLELAQANARRTDDLFTRQFIAERGRDEALANLKLAEAAVALAEARLARMHIRAPFAGTAGIRNVSVGDFVKDGQDLVNLEDTSRLKLDFRLPESEAARVATGQAIAVESDALPGRSFAARVLALDPQFDTSGRSLRVLAELPNPKGVLRPGMFVRVRLAFGERSALLIPEAALVPAGSDQFVFRVKAGEQGASAQRVKVAIGVRREGLVEIREGLAAGDSVVVAGQLKLRDGAAVKPMAPEGAAAAAPTAPAAAAAASVAAAPGGATAGQR